MKKTTNSRCREYVQARAEFEASNLSGVNRNGCYVVLSYGWYPLFVYKDGQWYENTKKYSMSTSKQFGQAHPQVDCVKLETKQLEALVLGVDL